MRGDKSFGKSFGDAIGFIIFIKYGLPILIILIVVLILFQGIYGSVIEKKYDGMDNVIVSSKVDDTIGEIVNIVYNKDNFSEVIVDKYSELSSLEIKYTFTDSKKNAEEFDSMIKDELTKVFNKLKGYIIKNNQIFGTDDDRINKQIDLTFYYPKEGGAKSYLASTHIWYRAEKGFDEVDYQNELNKLLVTNEKVEDAKKRSY